MIDDQRLLTIVREAATIAYNLWPGAADARRPGAESVGEGARRVRCAMRISQSIRFLRRELGRLLPSAGWLSEETADDPARLDNDLIWLVDPMDGTRDFIRGRPGWCVSVALISDGRP